MSEDHENYTRFAGVKSIAGKLVTYGVTQVDKLVEYSLSESSISESKENSIDLAERNLFEEDEEMPSFIDSNTHDDFSDEGSSSLGSEDRREVMFQTFVSVQYCSKRD